MASTPSPGGEPQEYDYEEDEEDEEEDDDDDYDYDEEEDEEYDPANADPDYQSFLESFFGSFAAPAESPLRQVVEVEEDVEEEEQPLVHILEEEEGEVEASGVGGGEEVMVSGARWDQSSVSPNCPVCFEPWAPDGPHRVW